MMFGLSLRSGKKITELINPEPIPEPTTERITKPLWLCFEFKNPAGNTYQYRSAELLQGMYITITNESGHSVVITTENKPLECDNVPEAQHNHDIGGNYRSLFAGIIDRDNQENEVIR